ncbi:MAG: cytochrome C [Acidobacteriota bacterium]|nr:cytochrome C [Acidobacteriota bacterium]
MSSGSLRLAAVLVWLSVAWAALAQSAGSPATGGATYVGSASCQGCHKQAYDGWKQTRMANVVVDPKAHPEAVLGDFKTPSPLVNFKLQDVALVYGSRWKQRYFLRRGDSYYVAPAQWDVEKKRWLPYHAEAGTDWWVPFYGASNQERPTKALCDGCHSVGLSPVTGHVTEWNVGCEACHGPGSEHVRHPLKSNIVNPERLDYVRGNDTCIQCHSQGRPLEGQGFNDAGGQHFDWPVGYRPGTRLVDYWRLEELKPGVTNFFQYADLTAHKNRMQGNDFIQSNMYHRQLRCFDCHEVHSNQIESNLMAKGNELCLNCHDAASSNPSGLKGTVSEHTHHAEGSAGSQCLACHMPRIEQTIKDGYVGAHTFRFITPAMTEQSGIPNPCTSCHKDKSTTWATQQLLQWGSVSPWRMTQGAY